MTANLADLVAGAAAQAPDGVALVSATDGGSLSWSALDQEVDRVAQGLGRLGLVAGNRVVLATANRPELVVLYFAALRARLVAVPVNPRSATGELVRMVADSRARLVVADTTTVDSARSAVAGLEGAVNESLTPDQVARSRAVVPRLVTLDCAPGPGEIDYAALRGGGRDGPARPVAAAGDAESLAVLLYTSGTSGRPQGAMLSHRALLANVEQGAAVSPPLVVPGDVVYGVLPLFHVYGLNAVLGQVVRQHATLVIADGFDPEGALADIERHEVTVLPLAPAVLAAWRDMDRLGERLSGVRTLMSGSAPLSPELVEEFTDRTGLAVHQGYGLTEAAPLVTSTLCSATLKAGSVGSALPGVRVRLVDETGRAPEGADAGEILVAGDNLFDGYWPDATDGPRDGWLHTGDVGFLDADGDLFLVDRLKELVIVSGFNVYPTEVEEVLVDVAGVVEAAVIGVPDAATGEAVVAYLRAYDLDPEAVRDLQDRAVDVCERRLARFKRPTRIEVVENLPHTVTGKIAKGRLRAARRADPLG